LGVVRRTRSAAAVAEGWSPGKCSATLDGMGKPKVDVDQLTTEERLDLIERLWDSFSKTSADLPLTDAQREELDRRLADLESEETNGIPWDRVVRRLRKPSP